MLAVGEREGKARLSTTDVLSLDQTGKRLEERKTRIDFPELVSSAMENIFSAHLAELVMVVSDGDKFHS